MISTAVIALICCLPSLGYSAAVNGTRYRQLPDNDDLWGLDRIDQQSDQLDHRFQYKDTGKGVNVYVIDSGLDAENSAFKQTSRVETVYVSNRLRSEGPVDCAGHGTHVSGIIAGKKYGVAKNANLFMLRVLDCQMFTPTEDIVDALEWIIDNHEPPAIINLSLSATAPGDPAESKYRKMIKKALKLNITVIAAAGNFGTDHCNWNPLDNNGVVVVGAVDKSGKRPVWSNYGECVSIFAPGENIISSAPNNQTAILSGTSQAAPFVTGVAALLLERNPELTPEELKQQLIDLSLHDKVKDAQSANNNLLQSIY